MNFHLNCPRGWVYSGDVSIEYGGKFYSVSRKDLLKMSKALELDKEDKITITWAEVAEFNRMDKQWWLSSGQEEIKISRKCLADAFETCGWPVEFMLKEPAERQFVAIMDSMSFQSHESELIQLGKLDAYCSSNPAVPDHIYHGRKSLGSVTKDWLKRVGKET